MSSTEVLVDALLLNDLNLLTGAFEVLLALRLSRSKGTKKPPAAMLAATAVRITLQLVAVAVLIYCGLHHSFGTFPWLEAAAAILLAAAAIIFVGVRAAIKNHAKEEKWTGIGDSWAAWPIIYAVLYLLPIAALVNLGVLLGLKRSGSQRQKRTVVWSVQLTIKAVLIVAVAAWYTYYETYAKAWHCYTHEARLQDYTGGFCPAYTKDGSYLDPANTVCRGDVDGIGPRCYGPDRTYDQVPRSWTQAPLWVHRMVAIVIQITAVQAATGLYSVEYFF